MDSLPPQLLLFLLGTVILLGFFNALIRVASVTINDSRLAVLAETNPKAKRLTELLDEPRGVMDALEAIGDVLAFLFAGMTVFGYHAKGEQLLAKLGMSQDGLWIHLVAIFVLALVMVFFYDVFWKRLPGRLATKHAETIAVSMVGYIAFVTAVIKPLLWLPGLVTNGIALLFGVRPHDMEEEVTEEEIRMMVDIGSESGAIDDDEKEMIHNIFELDDKPIGDIMTHRTEVCVLWKEDSLEDWRACIDETKHTRYPICDEEIDNVVGVINTRDFYKFLLDGKKKNALSEIMRKPLFVPDSMKADELFSQMQQENTHIVMVMDEYGGFQGLVTQKDLIEEIVGDLYSEDEEIESQQEIVKLDENTWKIQGSAEIEDVEEALGIALPEDNYNTFAGLVLDAIETLPEDGETAEVTVGLMQIKITRVEEHRIEETIVCLTGDVEKEEDPEE